MDGAGDGTIAAPLPAPLADQPSLGFAAKRTFDLLAAAALVVLLMPAWIAIAIAIAIDSRGPVLYRQRRIGRDGAGFGMLKFRTMHSGAHELRDELRYLSHSGDLFKVDADPRVTRVGRLLRATSLDELPQLLHVLSGRMSLVGPRPLVPDEDARVAPHLRHRLAFRPGMTGPWQVAGRERHSLAHMAELDSEYVHTWRFAGDLKLLGRTFLHVVLFRGR